MRRLVTVGLAILAGILLLRIPDGGPPPVPCPTAMDVDARGVEIDETREIAAPARADLAVGDVLLAWEQPAAGTRGTITSYFDVLRLADDVAPRGALRLCVERGGRRRLTFRPGVAAAALPCRIV